MDRLQKNEFTNLQAKLIKLNVFVKKYFSSFDLTQDYYQMPVKQMSTDKTAFYTQD